MDRNTTSTIARMIAWIEEHLDDDLTLDRIAEKAGYSPFHFSRLFLAATRRSVMAHVRARRLIRAARHLLSKTSPSLIDVALDSGFDSQEAFTRAFKRLFGTTPARFRAGFAVDPIEGQYPMSTTSSAAPAVEHLPEFATLDGFVVAGPARHFDETNKSDIPQLWTRLVGSLPFEGQIDSPTSYGVIASSDRGDGSFFYLAGVSVRPHAALPEGFETLVLPAATYARFRITLDGGPVHLQIKAAMEDIWGRIIPASGLTVAESPDFESYDGRTPLTQPGVRVDYYVPIRA